MADENFLDYRDQVRKFLDHARAETQFKWRDFASMTGQSYQNVHNKLKRGTLSFAEILMFADKAGLQLRLEDKETGRIIV